MPQIEAERRIRKERERAERKAQEAAESGGKSKETEEERQSRKAKERAERDIDNNLRPCSQHDDLVAAIQAENRVASRAGIQSHRAESRSQRLREEEEAGRERDERREQRRKERDASRKSRDGVMANRPSSDRPPTGTAAVDTAQLMRQGYRIRFEKDLSRATALRRLVDLDDTAAVIVDLAPLTEYDMYIRNFGENGKRQAASQAPCAEDRADRGVQADRIKQKNRDSQIPDDLGLYPEQYSERVGFKVEGGGRNHEDGEEDNEPSDSTTAVGGRGSHTRHNGQRPDAMISVDTALLGRFVTNVFPVVSATLDENAPGGGSAATDGARSKVGTQFSSEFTTYALSATSNRPVLRTQLSPTSPHCVAALYGELTEAGPSPELDRYASVILLWNIFDASTPESALVSFSPITCMCFSPSRSHFLYAGMADGSVCVWDLREPDRQHTNAGRWQQVTFRLPSYATSWQADNHIRPVCQVCIAGYNTVVGVRKDENEQLATLDDGGTVKFWTVNDRESQSKAVISNTEYGLHIGSSVRLSLAVTAKTGSGDGSGASAGGFDFAPSDAAHYVVACADGLVHQSRYGSVAAPSVYGPASLYFQDLVQVPACVQYSPTDSRILMAGYEDGTVRLFEHTQSAPQLTMTVGMHPILDVRCSSSHKWCAWALDQSGTLHLLDCAHRERETPRLSLPLTQPETGVCLCLDCPQEEKSVENRLLALGFEKGILQVHVLDNAKLQMPASERDEKWL